MGFLDLAARRRRSGGAPLSLNDQMQARLLGTAGFALDAEDLTKLWTDAGVTPVANNADPVGRWQSKFGTTTYNFDQATAGNQPAWDSAGALTLATDDRLVSAAAYGMTNAMDAFHLGVRGVVTTLAAATFPIAFSTSGTNAPRAAIALNTDGSVSPNLRRLNADSTFAPVSASGLIAANVPFTLQVSVEYLTTGAVTVWLNGSSIISTTYPSTGQSDASNSARITIGCSLLLALPFNGKISNIYFERSLPDASARASIKDWLESAGV